MEKLEPFQNDPLAIGIMLQIFYNARKGLLKALKAAKDTEAFLADFHKAKTAISHGRRWNMDFERSVRFRFELPENKATRNYYRVAL
ncbi:hypothetical protein SPFM9_00209 [Salmonella phage SPFM9]|nr:hypothetical protein SPFM9_00209 [Salmonella phage SPFM9]